MSHKHFRPNRDIKNRRRDHLTLNKKFKTEEELIVDLHPGGSMVLPGKGEVDLVSPQEGHLSFTPGHGLEKR